MKTILNNFRIKLYYFVFKKGKQYHWKIPYITYWGCDEYHWLMIHTKSWKSLFTGRRVNSNELFTILYNKSRLTKQKSNEA